MTDITASIYYLLTIELLGLMAWPFARRILKDLPDQGWAFAKILGILMVSWLMWLLASLHVLSFSYTNLVVVTLAVALFSIFIGNTKITFGDVRKVWAWLLIEEILFITMFGLWTYVRGFSPAINGLEKFMDYGFMVSAYRSEYFPPLDHFLARETINYYYFGHYIAAMLSKLSRVPTEFAYNLQMSAIMALTLIQAFALAASLFWFNMTDEFKRIPWRSWFSGIIAAIAVTLFGNLHAAFYLYQQGEKYWYPDATRFIEYTIHEFPIYSFIVNDLHGHVSDIPTVLLVLALLLVMFRHLFDSIAERRKNNQETLLQLITMNMPVAFITLAWLIGTTYTTNAWDFAIYLVVSGCLIWGWRASELKQPQNLFSRLFQVDVLMKTAINSIFLMSFAILLYLPFWRHLVPISQGIGIVPPNGRSPLWQLGILWGVHLPIVLIFLLWLFEIRLEKIKFTEKIVAFFANILQVKITIEKEKTTEHIHTTNPHLITLLGKELTSTDFIILIMILVSLLLIIAPEFIFIRDIYPQHYRANTMFKFYYQAWIMLGTVFGFAIIRLWAHFNRHPSIYGYLFKLLSLVLIYSALMYPYKAINQGFSLKTPRLSINGITYLTMNHYGDSLAIKWINEHIKGQPTMLEGVGDSYTDYARIASNTGLPTVMGWPVHEWLWRGTYGESIVPKTYIEKKTGQVDTVGNRVDQVKLIYEGTDLNETRQLLGKYEVNYVYVGDLERQKYPSMNENKFSEMGLPVVYDKENVKIYLVQ
ncbi:hypothetical protein HGA91_00680 [candidate division WWE3 bacterium]|nr:hypothetical protein [candidate division WWE3 bacterium]